MLSQIRARSFGLLAIWSAVLCSAALGTARPSLAQTGAQLGFRPGELIVGYGSDSDRRTSAGQLSKLPAVHSFNVLGCQKPQTLQWSNFQDAALLLKFELPASTNALAQGDPSFHRRLLEDLAAQIKRMDPRVKYVYPNWDLRLPAGTPFNPIEN